VQSEISAAGFYSLPTWAMQRPCVLLPSWEQPTNEIITQTSPFPIFYLARLKNTVPISLWAGDQLQQRRHLLQNEGRTSSPMPWSQHPHSGARGQRRLHAEQGGFACTKPPWCVHFLTRCGQGGNCTCWVGEG